MAAQLDLLWKTGRSKRYRYNRFPLESEEQRKLVAWLKENNIRHYAVPNGGYRHKSQAYLMMLEGVSPGVPDLCIPYPVKPYHGLYIELKRASGGVTSEKQHEWINFLASQGYRAMVCHGHKEAIAAVRSYFNEEGDNGIQ